jgi:DNA-binding CsgD family transcriptional regulator
MNQGSRNLTKKKLAGIDRQHRILEHLRADPSLTNAQLAAMLGVDKATISKDLRNLSEEFKTSNISNFELQRERILNEIRMNKIECMRRLRGLGDREGSRWMEEWTKLTEKEMKIVGIGTNETLTIERGKSFDKIQHDAAIAAMMKMQAAGIPIDDDVVEAEILSLPAPAPEPEKIPIKKVRAEIEAGLIGPLHAAESP